MLDKQTDLLPLGTRVTHFDGSASTHGLGTIIAYNGIEPCEYLKSNFKEAVEMAGKAGLLGGLVSGFYDKNRCPYVVRFDPAIEGREHVSKKYPKGYKDVYERGSINPLVPAENIFPSDNIFIMARTWVESIQTWTDWMPVTEQVYLKHLRVTDMEFCTRPAIMKAPQFSPEDNSFVPLSLGDGSGQCSLDGYHPPIGIFVEFQLLGEAKTLIRGLTAQLGSMGPYQRCETVFTCVEPENARVYLVSDVSAWRELVNPEDYTPAMQKYLVGTLPITWQEN